MSVRVRENERVSYVYVSKNRGWNLSKAVEMTQLINHLPCKYRDMTLIFQNPLKSTRAW